MQGMIFRSKRRNLIFNLILFIPFKTGLKVSHLLIVHSQRFAVFLLTDFALKLFLFRIYRFLKILPDRFRESLSNRES